MAEVDYPAEDMRHDLIRIIRQSAALIEASNRLVASSRERVAESERLLRAAEDKASLSAR